MSNDSNAATRQNRLDEILLRHDDLEAAGVTTPVLDEYVKLHPDLATELRSYFEDRRQLRKRAGPLCALAGMGEEGAPLPIRSFGKYEILRREGAGGMGIVVRAFDVEVKREVVLKVMKEDRLANPETIRRFRLEGQLLGQLVHPAIVPLHEMGETPDDRKLLYLAMKLVRGHTLDWLLKRRVMLEEQREWYLDVLVAVCHAVQFAHSKRVLHRDLKPANVMVGEHQEVQLTDFGLAKVMTAKATPANSPAAVSVASAGEQTTIGATPGSPPYMAPEQARGLSETLDERCDVFGLGGILCEILTGQPPRTLADIGILLRDLNDPAGASLAGARDRLDRCGGPAGLVALCQQCLSVEPSKRPASARAVADAVLAYRAALVRAAEEEKLKAAQATVRADAAVKQKKLAYQLLCAVVLLAFMLVGLVAASGAAWSIYERRKSEKARLEAETITAADLRLEAWKQRRAKAWTTPLVSEVELVLKEAREEAKAADEQARLGQAPETVLQRTREALAMADADLEATKKDRRVTARLLQLMVFGESSPSGSSEGNVQQGLIDADRRFADVFREWGLDPDRVLVPEAAERIRSRPAAVATELIAALDDWGYERRVHCISTAHRLFDLAHAADHRDPLRQELRELLASTEGPGGGEPALDRKHVQELAQKVNPREPTLTLLLLARALLEIGDKNKAISLLEKARQDPERSRDPLLLGQLGRMCCLVAAGELAEAPPGQTPPAFQQAVVCAEILASMRPEVRFMVAYAYLYTNPEKGLEIVHDLQREQPNDPDLQLSLEFLEILSLFRNNKLKEATAALKKVARNRDDDAGHALRLLAATIHLRLGEFTEAETLCQEVCKTSKSPLLLAGAHELIGRVKVAQRMEKEAIQAFGEALRHSQGIPSGYVYAAQKCEESGRLEEARTSLTEGRKHEPKNAALLVYAIEFYQRHGQDEEAQAFRRLLLLPEVEFPTDPRSLYQLGCGLMRIKEYKLAASALEQHLRLDHDHTAAKTMLSKARELQRSQQP
jgi:eukaryotic-like serine/threonine-protein kinase